MKVEVVKYKSSEYWALLDKGYTPVLVWYSDDGVELVRMEKQSKGVNENDT